jgi:hypothetical protein
MANPQATALGLSVVTTNYSGTATLSGAQAVGTLSVGAYVAAFLSGEEKGRTFLPPAGAVASNWAGATGANSGTGIAFVGQLYGSSTPVQYVLPSVVSVTVINDSAGNPSGPVKVVLQPASGDLVNASSVMTYWLDQEALVLTATGTF